MRVLVKTLLVLAVFFTGAMLAAISKVALCASTGYMSSGNWLFSIIMIATCFACWKVIRYKKKDQASISFDLDKSNKSD